MRGLAFKIVSYLNCSTSVMCRVISAILRSLAAVLLDTLSPVSRSCCWCSRDRVSSFCIRRSASFFFSSCAGRWQGVCDQYTAAVQLQGWSFSDPISINLTWLTDNYWYDQDTKSRPIFVFKLFNIIKLSWKLTQKGLDMYCFWQAKKLWDHLE